MQLSLFGDDRPCPALPAVRNDVRTGDAAELLVLFKLLKLGYDAHDARRDAPYDVAVDLRDGRVCRVQVKGRDHAHKSKWDFRFTRGNWRSATGTYAYSDADYDITACVALSIERVIFFPGVHSAIRLSTADFLRPDGEAQSWDRPLKVFKRKSVSSRR